MDGGLDPVTPAAAVEWGSVAGQRVIEAPAADLAVAAAAAELCAPATIIIGEVVRLRGQGLRWFDLPQVQNELELEYEALRPILEEI